MYWSPAQRVRLFIVTLTLLLTFFYIMMRSSWALASGLCVAGEIWVMFIVDRHGE